MTRVSVNLTEAQIARLRVESERTGVSVAELIRRAIDNHDALVDALKLAAENIDPEYLSIRDELLKVIAATAP